MGIERNIRNLQDRIRNSGWRISWIPWQEEGKPEYVYNTPLTLVTGVGGALMFLGAIIYIISVLEEPVESIDDIPREVLISLIIAVSGICIGILGRRYAAWHKQARWKPVRARCVDREIRKCLDEDASYVWEYRLVCTFNFRGKKYHVTPENSHIVAFNSEKQLDKYLYERIADDGTCRLYIDPSNPLHAVFDKKQYM